MKNLLITLASIAIILSASIVKAEDTQFFDVDRVIFTDWQAEFTNQHGKEALAIVTEIVGGKDVLDTKTQNVTATGKLLITGNTVQRILQLCVAEYCLDTLLLHHLILLATPNAVFMQDLNALAKFDTLKLVNNNPIITVLPNFNTSLQIVSVTYKPAE